MVAMNRFWLIFSCALMLMVIAEPSTADDVPRGRSVGVPVNVQPGQQIIIKFFFRTPWEHQVEIVDPFGAIVAKRNNFSDPNQDFVWTNTTGVPQAVVVHEFHKKSPPDGEQPWYVSPERVLRDVPGVAVIGFEDGSGDFDFQEAVVECLLR